MTWHHASPNYLLYMSINYPRVTHNVDNPEIQWGIALMDEQACPVATGAATPYLNKTGSGLYAPVAGARYSKWV